MSFPPRLCAFAEILAELRCLLDMSNSLKPKIEMVPMIPFTITEKMAEAVNKHFEYGTGPARLIMIRSGLIQEIRIPGMRMTSKAPKCSTILRKEFGMSGKPVKLLHQFEILLQMTEVLDGWDSTTIVENGTLRILTGEESDELKAQHKGVA